MNPSCGPERLPIKQGRGGDEDVNVVARRVGGNILKMAIYDIC